MEDNRLPCVGIAGTGPLLPHSVGVGERNGFRVTP